MSVLTFAPKPEPRDWHDAESADRFGRAAIWHLGYALNPLDGCHEFHTDQAADCAARAAHYAHHVIADQPPTCAWCGAALPDADVSSSPKYCDKECWLSAGGAL
jgi:hypothetical protein